MSATPAACRSCRAPIVFVRMASGRLHPYSLATGRSHFEDCPEAQQWRHGARPAPAQSALPGLERPTQAALPFDLEEAP